MLKQKNIFCFKMSKQVLIDSYNYAIDFIELIPEKYPNFIYMVDSYYVAGLVLQFISSSGKQILKDSTFNDQLIQKLEDQVSKNVDDIKNSYTDIISSFSDDLIDYFANLDEIEQYNQIANSIDDLMQNENNVYSNSSLDIVISKIEPYVYKNINM